MNDEMRTEKEATVAYFKGLCQDLSVATQGEPRKPDGSLYTG